MSKVTWTQENRYNIYSFINGYLLLSKGSPHYNPWTQGRWVKRRGQVGGIWISLGRVNKRHFLGGWGQVKIRKGESKMGEGGAEGESSGRHN